VTFSGEVSKLQRSAQRRARRRASTLLGPRLALSRITAVRRLVTALAVSSLLVSATATAGELVAGAAPLVGPPAVGAPPVEAALASVQLLAGGLATFGAGAVLILAGENANAAPLVLAGVAAGPGMGGWAVCALGRLSPAYDGDCFGAILGSYLGSVVFAIPAGIYGYYQLAPRISDGGYDHNIGAAYGAVAGIVIGAAVGATIGWHVTKHRRDQAPAKARDPVSPRTAAVAPHDWSDLRPRTVARSAPVTFSVPLLTLRF
jgi:hypothetical protein